MVLYFTPQLDPATGVVTVAGGGTGAPTAAGARTNLGLGTIATQNANAVAVTGGSITGITDLAVADGGTGSSTPSAARTALGVAIGTDVFAYQGAWTTFTPTVAATSGTITTVTGASGAYIQIGKTVHVWWQATITTNGTGSGSITFTVPVTPKVGGLFPVYGRESSITGVILTGTIVGATVQVFKYDNSYPAADGSTLTVSCTYEAA